VSHEYDTGSVRVRSEKISDGAVEEFGLPGEGVLCFVEQVAVAVAGAVDGDQVESVAVGDVRERSGCRARYVEVTPGVETAVQGNEQGGVWVPVLRRVQVCRDAAALHDGAECAHEVVSVRARR
jgi:hypothetical protein